MNKPIEDITTIDPYDPEIMECPWHYDAALREQAPVFHDKKNNFYAVSKHELIAEVIQNPDVYSSRYMEKLLSKEPMPDEVMAIYAQGYQLGEAMLVSDGEVHERHRRIATKAFSRKRLKELAPILSKATSDLIDKVIEKGEMEFGRDIAGTLPINTLQQQLRMPDDMLETAKIWSRAMESGLGGAAKTVDVMKYEAEQIVACQHYFADRLSEEMERIKKTGEGEREDDILTMLAQSILDPEDPMDMNEAISYIVNLFPATNGTTTMLLMACMHRFTDNPEVQARIAENPKLIAKLIEETMRHESPTRSFWRRTLKKTTLGGVEIPEGEWISLRISSAHRDACAYANAEEFDIDRKSTAPQLGFSSGIHICAGRVFARHIVTDVLTQLSQRASNFEFIEGRNTFEHEENIIIAIYKELHIKFKPI